MTFKFEKRERKIKAPIPKEKNRHRNTRQLLEELEEFETDELIEEQNNHDNDSPEDSLLSFNN